MKDSDNSSGIDNGALGYRLDDNTRYEGKMVLTQFSVSTDSVSLGWSKTQSNYFGHARALAYQEISSGNNIWIGGATDNNISVTGSLSDVMQWTPAIWRFNDAGEVYEQW